MPSSRPRITFNPKGICNACENSEKKKLIDWKARKKLFLDIIKKHKENKNNNPYYDCIVPWSGGKDSSSIAHKIKNDYGLNPLLVTFSPLIPNNIGEKNRDALLKLGFDSIFVKPNNNVSRKLAQRFFKERGNPKVAWDAGVNSAPIRVALNYKIPLVFYAEHGESEYGGLVLSEESLFRRDLTEVIEHQIGDYPENWNNDEISLKNLAPYIYPEENEFKKFKVEALYFSYFFKWSMFDNYEYVKENIPGFEKLPQKTDGTFTDFDSLDDKIDNVYYYLQYIKFGFGRATRDACRLIQNGHMTREEAITMANLYDHEFPKTNFEDVLSYLKLNQNEFDEIVNKHRNHEIWETNGNNWRLKFNIK